jgi:hypothetical protein
MRMNQVLLSFAYLGSLTLKSPTILMGTPGASSTMDCSWSTVSMNFVVLLEF